MHYCTAACAGRSAFGGDKHPFKPKEMPMWIQMTAPYQLQTGGLYAAHLHLSWIESAGATDADVVKKFADAGFTGVTSDLANRRAEGTWPGEDQAVELPPEVDTVWEWQV